MENAVHVHRHYLHHLRSPKPNQNRHQSRTQYVRFRLPMRSTILQRISSPNQIIYPLNRFPDPKLFSLQHIIVTNIMADQSKTTQTSEKSEIDKQGADQRLEDTTPLPPPPEKPLPGDCCGSGCVRCVWDIYYDELEDYNKLCKSRSDSSSNPKPS